MQLKKTHGKVFTVSSSDESITMPDGSTVILMNSPSPEACERFVRIVMELRRKTL